MHISSLISRFGIGDLGPQAYQFADLLAKNNQHFWQVLPLNPTELKHGNSPYHSYSSFAGNPLFVSPELLYQEGLLQKEDLNDSYLPEQQNIDFASIYPLKNKLLKKACHFFEQLPDLQQEFDCFCQQQTFWLNDYALFKVLYAHYPGRKWNHWPVALKERNPDALQAIQKKMANEIKKQKMIQFLFFRQWNQLKKYCHQKNINIIGDMPIYVTYHGADVWAHPEFFKLDRNKKPQSKSGVPPDYFSKTGQFWGNPVYLWSAHRKEKFHWWIKRIRHNIELVDLLRIDHFRGLVAYWEIPADEKTAINGHWVTGGGLSFFRMLNREFPDLPFIAEDLGVITDDVVQIINKLGLPGTRVLLFAFDKNFPHSHHLPHNHGTNCVVYTGTHDNNTIQGWLQKEIKPLQKRNLNKYLGRNIRTANAHWDLIRMAQASVAILTIIPTQDILGLGEEARMNYPSHANSNWQWHLTTEQMTKMKDYALPRLKELTQIYGREKIEP
jgi:4-alpha-glucanotransferase